MGPEQRPRPEDLSERDREMMGLGTRLETEKPDDEGSYKPDRKAIEKLEKKSSPPLKEATTKSRFANLEMTPPGMEGEELEKWKAEQIRKDAESKEAARKKLEEERFEEDYGPRGQF